MLFRSSGIRGIVDDRIQPGDLPATGVSIASITTAGSGTLTGAAIASGIVARTGPGAGFTDTTESAWSIIQALTGGFPAADVVQGISFFFTYQNKVAQAMTFAGGAGVTLGSNVNVAASAVRDYLVTILNSTAPVTLSSGTTNGNKIITFNTPIQTGTQETSNANTKGYGTITPGMVISGTGITAGTKVVGLTMGDQARGLSSNFIVGVTTDTNSTATNADVDLLFSPNVRFDGIGSYTA